MRSRRRGKKREENEIEKERGKKREENEREGEREERKSKKKKKAPLMAMTLVMGFMIEASTATGMRMAVLAVVSMIATWFLDSCRTRETR
jgi:hypothetical protein